MTRALLLIDIQLDYFAGGAFPLVEPEGAAQAARAVLDGFRDSGERIVHVFHTSTEEDATFFIPGTPGVDFHPLVAPLAGETVVEKHEPNSFLGTDLQARLEADGVDELVVVGMMTSMCVDSTVRAAAERGFAVTVVGDACAAPDLTLGDVRIDGSIVHRAFLAALDGSFADVVASETLAR